MEDLFEFLTSALAATMTPDDLANALEDAIAEYRETGDFEIVETACLIVITKQVQNENGGPEKAEAKLKQFKAFRQAFDHTQNNS